MEQNIIIKHKEGSRFAILNAKSDTTTSKLNEAPQILPRPFKNKTINNTTQPTFEQFEESFQDKAVLETFL